MAVCNHGGLKFLTAKRSVEEARVLSLKAGRVRQRVTNAVGNARYENHTRRK